MDAPGPAPVYVYRCHDGSVLAAWISRVLAPPLQRRLPRGVSANEVTVFGSLLMWLAGVGICATPPAWRASLAPAWVGLLWAYCVFDHVDGVHARTCGTSSPLGEFLDHALDAWNVALAIVLVVAIEPGALAPLTVQLLFSAAGLATVATWLEQHQRGAIFLGVVGPVEGVAITGLYVASWQWSLAVEFWQTPLGWGALTRADGAMLVSCAVMLGWTAVTLRQLRRGRLALISLVGQLAVALSLAIATSLPWNLIWIASAMAAAVYAGQVITSHLARTPLPWPDWIGLPLLAAVAVGAGAGAWDGGWAWLSVAWFMFATARAWRETWRRFGHHWQPAITIESPGLPAAK